MPVRVIIWWSLVLCLSYFFYFGFFLWTSRLQTWYHMDICLRINVLKGPDVLTLVWRAVFVIQSSIPDVELHHPSRCPSVWDSVATCYLAVLAKTSPSVPFLLLFCVPQSTCWGLAAVFGHMYGRGGVCLFWRPNSSHVGGEQSGSVWVWQTSIPSSAAFPTPVTKFPSMLLTV